MWLDEAKIALGMQLTGSMIYAVDLAKAWRILMALLGVDKHDALQRRTQIKDLLKVCHNVAGSEAMARKSEGAQIEYLRAEAHAGTTVTLLALQEVTTSEIVKMYCADHLQSLDPRRFERFNQPSVQ